VRVSAFITSAFSSKLLPSQAKTQELEAVVSERDALRVDLEQLLLQRGQLEGVKSLLMRMLAAPPATHTAAAVNVGGLASGAATARRAGQGMPPTTGQVPGLPLTTIIGEGAR
jgi:hypothetical protein